MDLMISRYLIYYSKENIIIGGKDYLNSTATSNSTYNKTSTQPNRISDTKTPSSPIKRNQKMTENVLILQGGGSLGTFGCGVFKAIAHSNTKLDIITGTSIGGVNAALLLAVRTKSI
jgi:predicted acylesterase/phospholipase RssA